MKRITIAVFVFAFAVLLCAQVQTGAGNLAGTWQGTLHVETGFRVVLKVSSDGQGGWKAEALSIDQTPNPQPVTSIAMKGGELVFDVAEFGAHYRGTMGADGNSIKGTLTQGGADHPLDFERATAETEWKADSSPHKVQFVEVEPGVKLEVLDWGGVGRRLVLLAGLGFDAHDFDRFAPKLTAHFHVYGITRRGFGASSTPEPTPENYSATRLGDDVLAVMAALKIERPVLAGHSIAGEELSSIGTRYPEKVAGLIYLDAGYAYAYYDPTATKGNAQVDWSLVRHEMDALFTSLPTPERKAMLKQLVETDLPRFEKDMQEVEKQIAGMPDSTPPPPNSRLARSAAAVQRGVEVYRGVKCPVLAIYAVPHDFSKMPGLDEKKRAEMTEQDKVDTGAQADGFAKGNPQARVVRIANADHFVFKSNEAEVLREIDEFVAGLP